MLCSEDQAYKSTFDSNDIELCVKLRKNNFVDIPSSKYILINNKAGSVGIEKDARKGYIISQRCFRISHKGVFSFIVEKYMFWGSGWGIRPDILT